MRRSPHRPSLFPYTTLFRSGKGRRGAVGAASRRLPRPRCSGILPTVATCLVTGGAGYKAGRSEEHTSELQSRPQLVCRLLLEKKKREGGNMIGGCLTPCVDW